MTSDEIEWVIGQMVTQGAIEKAEEECRTRAEKAASHLEQLPPSAARDILGDMCSFLIERVF